MTNDSRKPSPFSVGDTGWTTSGECRDDGTILLTGTGNYYEQPLRASEARALAHWLTLAAEYAESAESKRVAKEDEEASTGGLGVKP